MFNNFRTIEITKRAFSEPLQMEHNPRAFSPEPEPEPKAGFGNSAFQGYNPRSSIPPGYEPVEDFKAPHPNWAPQGYDASYFHPKVKPVPAPSVMTPVNKMPVNKPRPTTSKAVAGGPVKNDQQSLNSVFKYPYSYPMIPSMESFVTPRKTTGGPVKNDQQSLNSAFKYPYSYPMIPATKSFATPRETSSGSPNVVDYMKRKPAGFSAPVTDEYGNDTGKVSPLFGTPKGEESIVQIQNELEQSFPGMMPINSRAVASRILHNATANSPNKTITGLPDIMNKARLLMQNDQNGVRGYYNNDRNLPRGIPEEGLGSRILNSIKENMEVFSNPGSLGKRYY